LRERKDDIPLLFRKFAVDFAEKYRMPSIELDDDARKLLVNYRWQGNVRQLKNITEQISIIEENRLVTAPILTRYLPHSQTRDLPILYNKETAAPELSERELLYKILFDMKRDINELKKLIVDIMQHTNMPEPTALKPDTSQKVNRLYPDYEQVFHEEMENEDDVTIDAPTLSQNEITFHPSEIIEEEFSLQKREMDLIKRALDKHKSKRKQAALELGISERTLYRKIKEYEIQ
jgi:DNA-binding NtrC family response regulator